MRKTRLSRIFAYLLSLAITLSGVTTPAIYAESNGSTAPEPKLVSTQGTPLSGDVTDIPTDKRGGTFRWGTFASPIDMNPMLAKDSVSQDMHYFLFRGLLYYDQNSNLKPDLLMEMPTISSDKLTYNCKLKSGLKWQDGTPLTAHDVKFTLEFTLNVAVDSPRRTNFELVDQIEVINDTEFLIKLKNVDSILLHNLTLLKPIPKHIWASVPASSVRATEYNGAMSIGSGAYKITDYQRAGDVVLERNPNYGDGIHYNFDKMIFKTYPTQLSAIQGLERGEVDYTMLPESEYYRVLSGDKATAYAYDRFVFDTLVYNHNRPMFSDKRIRNAFAHLIDKQTIILSAYNQLGTVAQTSWHPMLPGYNSELKDISFDAELAKDYLDSAGWLVGSDGLRYKDGQLFKFKLITNKGNKMREASATIISNQLKEVGIVAEVQFIEWEDLLTNYVDVNNFDVYIGGFSFGVTGDQTIFYHSDLSKAPMNKGHYCNPIMDQLLDQMRNTVLESDRHQLIKQLQAILHEDQPNSPFVFRKMCVGASRSLRNVRTTGSYSILDIANYYHDGISPVENPLKISFTNGISNTVRILTPTFEGTTNASVGSPVKLTINSLVPVSLTGVVTSDGKWSITVPLEKALKDGQYLVSVEIQDALLGANTKYQSLKVDRTILYEGHVKLPSGESAYGSGSVHVKRLDGSFYKSFQIDSYGKFYINNLEKGDYKIQAVPSSSVPYGISNAIAISTDGITPDYSVFELSFTTPQIKGVVQTPEGQGTSGCYVRVQSVPPNFGSGFGADSTGKFYISNLADGTYDLTATPNSDFPRKDLGPSKTFRVNIVNGVSSPNEVTLKLSPPQLVGKIINETNLIVPNANVEIFNASGNYVASISGRSDGTFILAGLDDGVYDLEARVYNSIEYTKSKKFRIEIASGIVSPSVVNLTLLKPQVVGTVKNVNGTPHLGGWINFGPKSGGNWYGYGYDNQGRFAIGALDDGIYELRANPSSNSTGLTRSQTVTFEIKEGKLFGLMNPIDLIIQQSQQAVYVKSPSGQPAVRADVMVSNSNGNHMMSLSTNDQGACYLPNLNPGTYKIYAEPNYNSRGVLCRSLTKEIVIETGKPINVELMLTSPQVIGSVKNPDGSAHIGGWITYGLKDSGSRSGYGYDNFGNFAISGLQDGIYEIYANPNSNIAGAVRSNTTTFEIKDGKLIGGITSLNLVVQSSQQKITVKPPVGVSPVRAQLSIQDATGKYINGISTNDNGIGYLPNLAAGTYRIFAEPDWRYRGTLCKSITKEITISEGVPVNLEVELTKPQVLGVVKNEDGTAHIGGWISYGIKNYGSNGYGTDNTGKFAIGGLEDGLYEIYANPNNNSNGLVRSVATTFEIKDGKLVGDISFLELTIKSSQQKVVVKTPQGTNATRANVSVQDMNGMHISWLNANDDGICYLPNLEPGQYQIYAEPEWSSRSTLSRSFTQTITIASSQPYEFALELTVPQVTGIVKNDDGTPHPYASINYSSQNRGYGVGTDNQGRYAIGGLEDGTYELKAYPNGNALGVTQSKASKFEIKDGKLLNPLQSMDLIVPSSQIKVTVKTPNGLSMVRSYVQVRDGNGYYIFGTSTNEKGVCYLPNLEAGTYEIYAEPDSNTTVSVAKSANLTFNVVEGVPLDLALQLQLPQVKGKVLNPDSSASAYSYVEVRNADNNWVASVNANRSAEFSISNLKDGQYKLKARPGYQNSGMVSDSSEVIINVIDGVVVEQNIEIALRLPQVQGKLLTHNGSTATGGWIQLMNKDTGSWINGSSVNSKGIFSFSDLGPGNYTVEAISYNPSSVGFNSLKYEFVIASLNDGPKDIVLQYTKPQVLGMVKDPLGKPVPYSWLEVYAADSGWAPGQQTNEKGEFALGNLEVGKTYTIVANPRWGSNFSKSLRKSFTVEATVQEINLDLTEAMVLGEVMLPDGVTPAAHTYVWVNRKENGSSYQVLGTSTGQEGKFSIGALEPGEYEVFATGGPNGQYRTSTGAALTIDSNYNPTPSSLKITLKKPQVTGQTVLSAGSIVSVAGFIEVFNELRQLLFTMNMYEGRFALNHLAPGKYFIKAIVKPSVDMIYGDSEEVGFEIGDDNELKVESTTGSSIGLQLTENYVSGSIAEKSGVSLGKAWVEVGYKPDPNKDDIEWLKTVLVGSTGKYAIAGLADGTYYVQGFYMDGAKQLKTAVVDIEVLNKVLKDSSDTRLKNMVLQDQ